MLTLKGVSQVNMPSKIKKTILVKENSIVFDTTSVLLNSFEIKFKDGSNLSEQDYKLNALKATLYFYKSTDRFDRINVLSFSFKF